MAPTNWLVDCFTVSWSAWHHRGGLVTVLPIMGLIIYILVRGLPAISWEFLTGFPRDGMRAGGILPAIVGHILPDPGYGDFFRAAGGCRWNLSVRICHG